MAKQARSLSEINDKHWWREHPVWHDDATAMSLDEQKAAVFYEAYRRHPVVREAWLKRIRGPQAVHDFGWQMFAAEVLNHLPKTWVELGAAKNFFCQQLAEMLPPEGYSVWPAKPKFTDELGNEKKKKDLTPDELKALEAYDERCRKLAAEILIIPPLNEQSGGLGFLKYVTKLSDAGFVLVAIDNKSREAFNYGIQFLQRRFKGRQSFRAADTRYKFPERPSVWDDDYAWGQVIYAELQVRDKRRKKTKEGARFVAAKVFEFQELCKGLESFDKNGTLSDLMERLR